MVNWLAALDEVAKQSQHPEALKINAFLRQRALLAMPITKPGKIGLTVLKNPPRTDYRIYLMIITKSDIEKCPELDTRRENTASSVRKIKSDSSVLTVNSFYNVSTVWTGLIGLHEGKHVTNNASTSPKDHYESEAEAYQLEFEILRRLYGKPYEELIEKESKDFIGADSSVKMPDTFKFEHVFGSAISDEERDAQRSIVWLNLAFHFFQSKGMPEEFKNFLEFVEEKQLQKEKDNGTS